MGWKSTIEITREEAIQLILQRLGSISDEEVGETLESMGYGEDINLPYFGHNFNIKENENNIQH